MTQHDRIVDFMQKHGTITQADASAELGITKLATRISEMKRNGMVIYSAWERGKNRFGENTEYKFYALTKKALNARKKALKVALKGSKKA